MRLTLQLSVFDVFKDDRQEDDHAQHRAAPVIGHVEQVDAVVDDLERYHAKHSARHRAYAAVQAYPSQHRRGDDLKGVIAAAHGRLRAVDIH